MEGLDGQKEVGVTGGSQERTDKRRLTKAEYKAFLDKLGIKDAVAAIKELGLNVADDGNEGDDADDAFEACA